MVRELAPGDLQAIVALFRRSVHETAAAHYEPEQLAAWAPKSPAPPRWVGRLSNEAVFVYESHGQVEPPRIFRRLLGVSQAAIGN